MPKAKALWAQQNAFGLMEIPSLRAHDEGAVKSGPDLKMGAAKRLYDYIRDNHANVDLNPVGLLLSYLKRLEAIKIGKFEASVKAQELHKLYKLEEINQRLDDLNSACTEKPIFVLVDELDRGWDGSEDAIAFVSGLFQAANSINGRTPNIHVLISLRRELYENIPALFDDAQKVRDSIETIEWRQPQIVGTNWPSSWDSARRILIRTGMGPRVRFWQGTRSGFIQLYGREDTLSAKRDNPILF